MAECASLDSPRAKLNRAREHLEALDQEVADFYDAHPYEIGAEFRPDTATYVFWVEPTRQPRDTLGLLLGDFAHNLRCALDHLVCQLARLTGATNCARTQFPICASPEEFARRKPTWLAGVGDDHRAAIEQAQPYHAGELADSTALRIVQWLDNVDKHRTVHPSFGYLGDPGLAAAQAITFTANDDAGAVLTRAIAKGRRIKGKTEIAWVTLVPRGPNPLVEMHGQLTFTPAFGERWLRGDALEQVERYVRSLVESFAPAFE